MCSHHLSPALFAIVTIPPFSFFLSLSKDTVEIDSLLQLKDAMQITFSVVIDFLLPVNDQIQFGNLEVGNNSLVQACARILSIWFTEENETHLEGSITLLPLFIRLSKEEEGSANLFGLFVPMFLQLTTDDRTREPFVQQGGLPLIVQHLCARLRRGSILSSEDVAKIQLPLECLLNIATMAPGLIKGGQAAFLELGVPLSALVSQLASDSSPSTIPLSLIGSVVLLLLSVAKELKEVIEPAQANSAAVVQGAHYFIKSGLGCKLGHVANSAEIWRDISELWFLCLAVFADTAAFLAEPSQTLLLSDLLLQLESAPKQSFTPEDLQYTALFLDKVARVVESRKKASNQ